MFRVVIPARYASTRLPGKPLRKIAGRPMVQHVYEKALASGAAQVIIATDHDEIEQVSKSFATVVRTKAGHASGTDRIAEVAQHLGWRGDDIVVNVQSDEPLMPPAIVRQVAELLDRTAGAEIATLATPIRSVEELFDPNVVKVAATAEGRALYFSRAPIPWTRDGASGGLSSQTRLEGALRHIGLYAYRVAVLLQLAALPPTRLERIEKLEQLRALENGMEIVVANAVEIPGPGVDTESDLEAVARCLPPE
jgi:3-deoxy-manno-octulosonate cytidylyltransferase (CMP-KDO synthetase)